MEKCLAAVVPGLLVMLLGGCQTGTSLWMGPYATRATETSAEVLWVTAPGTARTALAMEQGAKIEIRTRSIPKHKEVLHVASITGLEPGQKYRYLVVFSGGDGVVGDKWGEFATAPVKGSTAPLRFVVTGDTRTYPKRHLEVATAIDEEGPLAFVAESGDLVGDGTVWAGWKKQYFDPAADLLRHKVVYAGAGNHEKDGVLFQELFDMPQSYYSADYGNVHFVVLNSELWEGKKADPAMLAWLEKDLMESQADWKLVSYHRPTFDVITHRTTWGQADLLPVLERCGVDMVLNGHTHNYQRFRPIGEEGHKPIIFVVSAGGGAPNYAVNPAPILEKSYSGLHYCLFNVSGNTLEMTAKYPNGKVLDHLTLVKKDGMYQKEIMDRAISTTFAREAEFLLTGFYAAAPEPPIPGQLFTMQVSPLSYPEGATVEVATAIPPLPKAGEIVSGQWIVPAVRLTGFKGRAGVDEDHSHGEIYEPLTFKAFAPADVNLSVKGFSPGIRVSLKVTYKGQTYTTANAGVFFRTPTIKAWAAQRGLFEIPAPLGKR